MVKKIIAITLSLALTLCGCGQSASVSNTTESSEDTQTKVEESVAQDESATTEDDELGDIDLSNTSMQDEELIQYVEDTVYSDLESTLDSEDYIIENVSAVYVSKEYLEELEYNSKSNIFFGYSLEEVEKQFDDEQYVFTTNDEGKTVVAKFEDYDDTYDQIIRNVAIGGGVILVCVTVTVVSAGLGAPAVSMIFATAASTGTEFAISGAVISGAVSAAVTGYETKDLESTVKASALAASEGFKWGAISGVVLGGVSATIDLAAANLSPKTIPTPRESEEYVLKIKGGREQVSYIGGKEVPFNTPGATRPDVVVQNPNGTIEAIEVKNYNLASAKSRQTLYSELERQITARVQNLPADSTQRIILDTRNREYTTEIIETVTRNIHLRLDSVYPNIPIEIL
ncbi:hypothetical protein [Pseudobutyrivibrio xylanivorans]|uniref:Uncharacterized protein n=1 Tax=Pseudobutyrivibrio xylanivorans TaxID=185007 RepID=A0A5P6VLE3_PSEXY|nr:hypothetical protein [Pseudobutyrivibrio xylanivorans]QFJ53387.1 hypothetical protein FXF36_00115 [Pseudobutyrivibrio xylanivorans]QFJ53464.1 hypothetical protein FXF36_00525 [Pseudobutyrivibrio xylanivorans]